MPTFPSDVFSQIDALLVSLTVAASVALLLLAAVLMRRFFRQKNTFNIELTRDSVLCGAAWIEDDAAIATLRLEHSDLQIEKTIFKGSLAIVYLARMSGDNQQVAVKKIRIDKAKDAHAFTGLLADIRLRSKLEHPKVVRFVGYCWGESMPELALVTEFMPNGNLGTLLKKQNSSRSNAEQFSWYSSQSEGTPAAKLLVAIDIADALVYLHTLVEPIVHGEVQAENVLLSADWEARLSGFGAEKSVSELLQTGSSGCIAWTAPEILKHEPRGVSADIYSFGVFLAELDACANPFATTGLSSAQIALSVSQGELKPAFRPDCPSEIVDIAMACLSVDPADRPMSMKLHYDLRQLYRASLAHFEQV